MTYCECLVIRCRWGRVCPKSGKPAKWDQEQPGLWQ